MESNTSQTPAVLLLGIGNVLWADEGFGVRALEALRNAYDFPAGVTLMDGGTQGVHLLQAVQDAEVLVLFDAVDYGLPGGTLKVIEGDAVPKFLGAKKMSLHQTGFQEVLMMAEMLGGVPAHLLLIGVQPVELEDYGGSLRPAVKARIPEALEVALNYLKGFGIHPRPRAVHEHQEDALALARYEAERPSAQAALRQGDARVLLSDAYRVDYRPAVLDEGSISVDVDHRGKY